MPWLVLTTTGSATKAGIVAAAELAPMVVTRALSGPLIDRLGAARCAVLADTISAVSVALVPLLWGAQILSFPALLAAVAILGAARGPGDSAKQTMLPALAASSGHPLERITGIGGTAERLASSVGLALGGVIVAAVGGAQALAVTALGFAVSAVLTLIVLRPALATHQPPRVPGQGYLTELNEGFTGLRRDPVLVGIVIMIALTNAIDQAYVAVLLPTWVLETGHGAQTLGWLLSAFMVAAVLGAVVATALASRLPRLPVYLAAFLLCGAPRFLVLVLDVPLPGVLATMAVTGFGAGFITPILSAVILERAPLAVRGRVVSLIGAASIALTPFGGLLGGLLIDHTGLVAALVAAGVAYFTVTMFPATVPAFRHFGQRPEPAVTTPETVQN